MPPPGPLIKTLRYALMANAAVDLANKAFKFVHGQSRTPGEHKLSDDDIRHIKSGGTIIFKDQNGNEVHRYG